MKNKLSLGFIVETIFLNIPVEIESALIEDDLFDKVIDFSIDAEGNVRKAEGIVSWDEASYKNNDYVPHKRFDISLNTSHSVYFEIELPNPFEDLEYSKKIRQTFINELDIRLSKKIKNAKARISRKNK